MFKNLIFTTVLLLAVLPCAQAQKKELAKAKANIKAGTSLTETETSLRKLLADSAYRNNEKVWLVLFDAVKKQYDKTNEEMYLHQTADTAQLLKAAYRMYGVLEGLDSIDMQPDEAGRVRLKYRKKHAEYLNLYRPNLYSGGLYFMRKQDYAASYDFFHTYIDCQSQPLFSGYQFMQTDRLMPQAAFYAVYCGYKLQDSEKALRYVDLARRDTAHLETLYQYVAETYKLASDTAAVLATLQEGFGSFPHSTYFFPHLFDYYFGNGFVAQASALCEKALRVDSSSVMFRFAMSSVLLAQGKYGECISICDSLIAANDSLADVYLNAGLAYYNQGVAMDRRTKLTKAQRSAMLDFYSKAMPYLQRYRQLSPAQIDRWGLPLYTIYLNLNMGKEFEEVDTLLRKAQGK